MLSANTANFAKKRQYTIDEFLETEQKYSAALGQIIEASFDLEGCIRQKKFQVSNPNIQKLFGEAYKLFNTSHNLIQRFKAYNALEPEHRSLIQLFDGFLDSISILFVYISLYHQFLPLYKSEKKTNSSFLQWTEKYREKFNTSMEFFLLAPIQRPPRYKLLISEIIKYTEKEKPERPFLENILELLDHQIHKVDQRMESFDIVMQMAFLQTKIRNFEVLIAGRRLFAQSSCMKQSRKRLSERYLVMFSDIFLVCFVLPLGQLIVHKNLKTGTYIVETCVGDENTPFPIDVKRMGKKKSFRCQLPDALTQQSFIKGFAAVVENANLNMDNILSKDFSPVFASQDSQQKCSFCDCLFSFSNRKRHCSKCRRLICKKCRIEESPDSKIPSKLCAPCFGKILRDSKDVIFTRNQKEKEQSIGDTLVVSSNKD